jgi:hypothetical protein
MRVLWNELIFIYLKCLWSPWEGVKVPILPLFYPPSRIRGLTRGDKDPAKRTSLSSHIFNTEPMAYLSKPVSCLLHHHIVLWGKNVYAKCLSFVLFLITSDKYSLKQSLLLVACPSCTNNYLFLTNNIPKHPEDKDILMYHLTLIPVVGKNCVNFCKNQSCSILMNKFMVNNGIWS